MSLSKIIETSRIIVNYDYLSAKARNKELYESGDIRGTSEYVYDNQKEDANFIVNKFYNNKKLRVISCIKKTKVGANGLIIELSKNFTTHYDDTFCLHRDNIKILTGMSSVSWENDMKDIVPNCLKENIYHHGKLQKADDGNKIKELKNGLIIIDEIDVGDKKEQKLHNILKNLLDIKKIEENNIRFIFISATIHNELKELDKWGSIHETYKMTIPSNYIGHEDFLKYNIIKEFYPIKDDKNAEKWVKEDIIENYGTDYRVHIIRTEKKYIDIITNACIKYNIEFRNHTSDDKISYKDLEEIFKRKDKHIVIIIKGLFARADLIPNNWKIKIGTTHEKYVKDGIISTQIQGLPGRLTGYWKNIIENGHKTGPYRTSIIAINKYIEMYNNVSQIGIKSSGKLFMDPKNIKNLEIIEPIKTKTNERIPIIIDGLKETDIIFHTKEKKEKYKFITELLLTKIDIPIYKKLYNFIINPDVICCQITMPESVGSYKRHIIDTVNKNIANEPFSISVQLKYKEKNNWQVFIDNKEKRLCFIIWCINDEFI
jgi:hypothetical protein